LPTIQEIQHILLSDNELSNIVQLEFDTLSPIIEMEYHGMPFNWDAAEGLRGRKKEELSAALRELEKEARGKQSSKQMTLFGEDAGVDINFRSPAQITKYLKDKLGFMVDSSDVETLKSLDHPFCEKLLKYRTIEKHLNFIVQFEEFGGKSGRATGRMSSSRPNGQQIPKRGDGKVFRTLFMAKPGYKLVKVDFSAIELRVMARLAMDNAMISALNDDVDLHKLTASKTSHKAMNEVTKDDRQRAKAVNFGLIYGMSAPTLKKYAWFNYGVRMSDQEAENTREAFFDLYKGIQNWHGKQKNKMQAKGQYYMHTFKDGYFNYPVAIQNTVMGRKRFWPNFRYESMAKPTEFFNSADQGTSADITKLALIRLYRELPPEAHLIGAVHDEIIVECPEAIAKGISTLMVKVMCEEGEKVLAPIPVTAEAEIGDAWGN
jgi:DNA polymerase I